MKLADKINEIESNPSNVGLLISYDKIYKNVRIVIIEYWNKVGNSEEVIGYCKKFVITDYGKEAETIYEDKATISQVVRARGW